MDMSQKKDLQKMKSHDHKFIIIILNLCLLISCITPTKMNIKGEEVEMYGKKEISEQLPEGNFIPADNPYIKYYGRIDFSEKGSVKFDWPGINIFATFEGTSCTVYLIDGYNDYNIFIDEKFQSVLETKPDTNFYKVAQGLKDGKHTIGIVKRTEGSYGIAVFKRFILDKGKKLLPSSLKTSLKIEFIGDSITCGYGNEASGVNCDSLRKYENSYTAFGPITARELNAEYTMIAISGKGMVRNYGDINKKSRDPLPFYYKRVLQNNPEKKWNFSKWIPDIVVIALGSNDFSTPPFPDKENFIELYKKFYYFVREQYPDAAIICLCTRADKEIYKRHIKNVYKELIKEGEKKVCYLEFPIISSNELGYDYHPNVNVHKKFANTLINFIKENILGIKNEKKQKG